MLKHILPNLETNPVSTVQPYVLDYKQKGVLRQFTQSKFFDNANMWTVSGLDTSGYIYYPKRCVDGSVKNCKLMVMLHGCGQQVNGVQGWGMMEDFGFLNYAASNDLIVLMPQIYWSYWNLYSCFDFF